MATDYDRWLQEEPEESFWCPRSQTYVLPRDGTFEPTRPEMPETYEQLDGIDDLENYTYYSEYEYCEYMRRVSELIYGDMYEQECEEELRS